MSDDLGFVAWWEWAEGKRPPGWTKADEERSRFSGILPDEFERLQLPPARPQGRLSRVHVVFDERGEVAEYELAPSQASRRQWAAMMLARDVYVFESILAGRPVLSSRLDGGFLGRALRDAPLPDPESFLLVTEDMLNAVAEAGQLPKKEGR